MKSKILKMLRNENDYISGQDICNQLGVSRTAIWKNIKTLKEEGYEIDSINNKGYKIISYPDLVSESEIYSVLNSKWLGQNIVSYDTIDSTNIEAKKLAEAGAANGTVLISELQTQGKGRRGKGWIGPKGSGIWMTLLLKPDMKAVHASMLTLIAALAVNKGILLTTGCDCSIKWPNDIVLNGKKLCGILTEMSTEMEYINYVVVGIGINVNTANFHKDIEHIATSLHLSSGKFYHRSEIVAEVLKQFEYYYELFLKDENLNGVMDEYNSILINVGKEVKIIQNGEEYVRTAIGINKQGELLVKDSNGHIEKIISGEVSVRGLYGYI